MPRWGSGLQVDIFNSLGDGANGHGKIEINCLEMKPEFLKNFQSS